MATDFNRLQKYLECLDDVHDEVDWKTRLRPKDGALPPTLPRGHEIETVSARWDVLPVGDDAKAHVADPESLAANELVRRNIENYIGTVKVPVGVAGPLRVNGMFAQGDYYYPLATTEATLVASYNRGARAISEGSHVWRKRAGIGGAAPYRNISHTLQGSTGKCGTRLGR